jgi:hypothetical protein
MAVGTTRAKAGESDRGRGAPVRVRCMLWGAAAGRCEFAGCNQPLLYHPKTKDAVNIAEVAHIIGFSGGGPRRERDLPRAVLNDVTNLMVLCGACHKLIDDGPGKYTVELLRAMKSQHERRISVAGGIAPERQSHILLYGANVGDHSSPVCYDRAACGMFPDYYPADTAPISLGLGNSALRDRDGDFWRSESMQLRRMVDTRVRPRLADGSIHHLSVFAMAPQPLLMLLGSLLSDVPAAEVYQLHREPADWRWQPHPEGFDYTIAKPESAVGVPALVLSLSATVEDERVAAVLGPDVAIWRVTVPRPGNDLLKSRQQLQRFREVTRALLDEIKARHGEGAMLHVFPAVPVATAVEVGRVLMPKADLPLRIYDEARLLGGFVHALDLNDGPRPEGGAR